MHSVVTVELGKTRKTRTATPGSGLTPETGTWFWFWFGKPEPGKPDQIFWFDLVWFSSLL
jgi:hypothetical protein